MSIDPIPTTYRSCRFRSRLEARWAVFFDRAGVEWQYEPQGFMVRNRPYLPDFYLRSGTWVEVKGAEDDLDHDLMEAAPACLPGQRLLILGPVPEAPSGGNWAWLGLYADLPPGESELVTFDSWWEFGDGGLLKPARETSCPPPFSCGDDDGWLEPALNMVGDVPPRIVDAYRAARSARFEHGESGAA